MPERSFITFYIGKDLYGIDILYVREIIKKFHITSVQRAPFYIAGLLDVRGQIITTIDLATKINTFADENPTANNCIIIKSTSELEKNGLLSNEFIFSTNEESSGFIVGAIGDVVSVNTKDIITADLHNKEKDNTKFFEGIISLENKILVTLNLPKLLSIDNEITVTT